MRHFGLPTSVALLAAFNLADCAGKVTPGLPALRLRCAWHGNRGEGGARKGA